ncbi:hypothetical protein J6TS1_00130 [Siminovitchia terrae]|uniref:Glycoside-hydrolase family GH114 TIM-barrel domain-containing protein n=1 Tax=Siminovitchia terrae TaxID=1914933 RepID=A0ABQ4KQ23_SIMTE|nr:endo alpha-1,4 polygalactosaminidase [Siminovitchia terrae]GIN94143.1 hypothetical protein J6TS1_00130 [Siminovitchia terrae]
MMQKIILCSCVLPLFILGSCAERTTIKDIERFKYYLDKGSVKIGDQMKEMDLVIVEPIEMQQDYISAAQQQGTLVYGYINAMEGDKWNKELYHQFKEDDFYKDENGTKMYFEQWDSYMMDMTSVHYQKVLLEEIENQVVQKGLDGVFLDTVGNINSFLQPDEQRSQNEAMREFMKKIKAEYDDLSIGQNWGFDTLMDYTTPYVDFIMWEDFSYREVAHDEWALEKMERLQKLRKQYGIQVLAIGFKDEAKSKKLSQKYGFKYLHNENGSYYNEW